MRRAVGTGLPRRFDPGAGWAWVVPDQTAKKASNTGQWQGRRVYHVFAVIELMRQGIDIMR